METMEEEEERKGRREGKNRLGKDRKGGRRKEKYWEMKKRRKSKERVKK